MRKKIAAGNWKMNLSLEEAQSLVSEIIQITKDEVSGNAEILFAPSFPYLAYIHHLIKGNARFRLAAQNLHSAEKGAYTGEVSASMLKSVGVTHCLVGHSERRQYFQESHELLAAKLNTCLKHGLIPVFCYGETLAEREAGETFAVLERQIKESCFHLGSEEFGRLVLAYEPVWAIGTGKTASPAQAQEVHAFTRNLLRSKYGEGVANECTILYGGSVTPQSATELFSQPDIDGGLVGGASLKSRDFTDIIKALH